MWKARFFILCVTIDDTVKTDFQQLADANPSSGCYTRRRYLCSCLSELKSVNNIGALEKCQAVLTGYQGSAEQCLAVEDTVTKVKQANPDALYVCDPVMGAPDKGCIVALGIAENLLNRLMPMADVIVPNQFELSQFAEMEIHTLDDAIIACQRALAKGPIRIC